MKKTKIITAAVGFCVAASMMAGCSSQGGSTGGGETAAATRIEGGQTQISVEATVGDDTANDGEYGVIYNGYKIVPGMPWNDAKAILGDDYDQELRADCAGSEFGNTYWYEGVTCEYNSVTRAGTDVEIIEFIDVADPIIDCGGFHVGDNIENVKAVLGTPDSDLGMAGVEYWGNTTKLIITPDETGKIMYVKFGLPATE